MDNEQRLFLDLPVVLRDKGPMCTGLYLCGSAFKGGETAHGNRLYCNHSAEGVCLVAVKRLGRVFETACQSTPETNEQLGRSVRRILKTVKAAGTHEEEKN